jgi:hypothetical protein
MKTVTDVRRKLVEIYGPDADRSIRENVRTGRQIVHSVAAWRAPDGLRIIRMVPGVTPKSSTDWFILCCARARCACLLTSGKNLRDEPESRHDTWADQHPGLLEWRLDDCGYSLDSWPRSAILTRNVADDTLSKVLEHELIRHSRSKELPVLYSPTSLPAAPQTTASLLSRFEFKQVDGFRSAILDARSTVGNVLSEPGSTSNQLYGDAFQGKSAQLGESATSSRNKEIQVSIVDELLLSIYEGPLAPEAQGELLAFQSEDQLMALFPNRGGGEIVQEESGPWRFYRFWK